MQQRLQKCISEAGVVSRRAAETMKPLLARVER